MRTMVIVYQPRGEWASERTRPWLAETMEKRGFRALDVTPNVCFIRTDSPISEIKNVLRTYIGEADTLVLFDQNGAMDSHTQDDIGPSLHHFFDPAVLEQNQNSKR